jgi:hypothetical protein
MRVVSSGVDVSSRGAETGVMADATRKTQATDADVASFLAGVMDDRRRDDALRLLDLMRGATGHAPVLWGSSIIGFGDQPYTTADGKEHQWFAVGFSPRKAALTLYGLTFYGSNGDLLERLGPHSTGKGCLYLKRLDDVDHPVLIEMIVRAWTTNHVDGQP